jgi:hypothetical protein
LERILNKLASDQRIVSALVGPPKILGVWFATSTTITTTTNTSSVNQQNNNNNNEQKHTIGSGHNNNIKVPDVHDVDIWVTLEQDQIQYPQIRYSVEGKGRRRGGGGGDS